MNLPDHRPLLYLITKGGIRAADFREKSVETLALIEKAVTAEISLIQIREKHLPAALVYNLAVKAARLTRNSNTKLLVNDRADIALAAGADGVHLTSESLPADAIRASFPGNFIVGVSAHSREEVEKAKRGGADFATFGPVFATPSKARYGAPQGVAKLREVSQTVGGFPVVALGGIDESNFRDAFKAGARGIAAIRFFGDADDLRDVVKKVRSDENE